MAKGVNASVSIKECRGNVERMIRRFSKKVKKERILEEVKDRRFFKKKSIAKREKQERARRLRLKEEQKRNRKKY
jgi:ribosomal protein S21|tara:strand:- start:395 stop:619 length:225 start_codon:yes stop_codon:yes gene_type:complete